MSETTEAPRYPFAWPSPTDQPAEFDEVHGCPVHEVALPSGDHALLLTRYDDVRRVLADPRVSKNRNRPDVARMTATPRKPFQHQVAMDPPAHTRMRKLIAREFTATRVERLRPRIAVAADELLDDLAALEPPVDLDEHFSHPLTIRVIADLLGVPEGDRDALGSEDTPPWQYMRDLIEAKRVDPGDDLISALVAVHDADDAALAADELHWWATMLLLAGYETTASQLSSAVVALHEHPDQLAVLRRDPSGMPDAVEELLRTQLVGSSLSMLRYVVDDIEVAGQTVPRGSSVIPSLECANHDPAAFDRPDEVDLRRRGPQQLTFSSGQHFCVGASLARAELQIGLEALLRGFPTLALAVPAADLERRDDAFFQRFARVPVTW